VTTAAPPVSIVIATYNRAQLLPESMDSVLGQDYPDLELWSSTTARPTAPGGC